MEYGNDTKARRLQDRAQIRRGLSLAVPLPPDLPTRTESVLPTCHDRSFNTKWLFAVNTASIGGRSIVAGAAFSWLRANEELYGY